MADAFAARQVISLAIEAKVRGRDERRGICLMRGSMPTRVRWEGSMPRR